MWTVSVVRRVDVEVTVFVVFEDGLLVGTTMELVVGGLEDLLYVVGGTSVVTGHVVVDV